MKRSSSLYEITPDRFQKPVRSKNKLQKTIKETATEVLAHCTAKPEKGEIILIVDGKK